MSSSLEQKRGRGTVLRGDRAVGWTSAAFDNDLFSPTRAQRDMLDAAWSEGYHAGLAEGTSLGREQGRLEQSRLLDEVRERSAALRATFVSVAEQTAVAVEARLHGLEDEIAAAAIAIAEAIVGRELRLAIDPGRDAIARALQIAPDDGRLLARLHPDDARLLGDEPVRHGDRIVTVISDATLQPGDCVLECGDCQVDARIGTALERVRSVINASSEMDQ